MKVIVSSTILSTQLQAAFDNDCHVIQYYGGEGTIIFGTTKYQSDVRMSVERRYEGNETITFNALGMAKLLLFVRTISEQPIVLTIEEETIRVEQAVIDFIR